MEPRRRSSLRGWQSAATVSGGALTHPGAPLAADLQRLLAELALEKDDVATLMAMADSDGDGVISFAEFKQLMQVRCVGHSGF